MTKTGYRYDSHLKADESLLLDPISVCTEILNTDEKNKVHLKAFRNVKQQ